MRQTQHAFCPRRVPSHPGHMHPPSLQEVWRRGHRGVAEQGRESGHRPQGREGLVLLGRWPVRRPRRMARNKPGAKGGQLRASPSPRPQLSGLPYPRTSPLYAHTHAALAVGTRDIQGTRAPDPVQLESSHYTDAHTASNSCCSWSC